MEACPARLDPVEGARRLGWALALSALFHFALIASLRADFPAGSLRQAARIEARIAFAEPAPSMQADDDRQGEPQPASLARAEDARAENAPASADPPGAESRVEERSSAPPSAAAHADPPAVPAIRDASYYAVAALDRPPMPLAPPDACYPHGADGEVEYELLIDEHGIVNRAAVVSVRPLGLFTAAAEELCAALRFAPAVKDGRAVRSKVRMVVGPH